MQVGPGRDKIYRNFLEEEASVDLARLIKNARVDNQINNEQNSIELRYQRLIQPDFCNEKRGYQKVLAPEGFGVIAKEPTM